MDIKKNSVLILPHLLHLSALTCDTIKKLAFKCMEVGVGGAPGPPALWHVEQLELRQEQGPAPTLLLSMEETTALDLTQTTSNVSKSTALVRNLQGGCLMCFTESSTFGWDLLSKLTVVNHFRDSCKGNLQMEWQVKSLDQLYLDIASCWKIHTKHNLFCFSCFTVAPPRCGHQEAAAWGPGWDALLTALHPQPAGLSTWILLVTASCRHLVDIRRPTMPCHEKNNVVILSGSIFHVHKACHENCWWCTKVSKNIKVAEHSDKLSLAHVQSLIFYLWGDLRRLYCWRALKEQPKQGDQNQGIYLRCSVSERYLYRSSIIQMRIKLRSFGLCWLNWGWEQCSRKEFVWFEILDASGPKSKLGWGEKFGTHLHKLLSISESPCIGERSLLMKCGILLWWLSGNFDLAHSFWVGSKVGWNIRFMKVFKILLLARSQVFVCKYAWNC